jgi:hypothetical protein
MMILVHHWGCNNFKEIIIKCKEYRAVITLCRKIMMAKYFRILKLLIQTDLDPQPVLADKIKLINGKYKHIWFVMSKEFRLLLSGKDTPNGNKLGENIDEHTSKDYLTQVKRLISTKHKNTLLRVWNGDCLSNSRLVHYGIVDSNRCPKCNEIDSTEHMLITCRHAERVWNTLMNKIPKGSGTTMMQYAIGINDTKTNLMIKAEILKYLMHYRELNSDNVINRTKSFLQSVNSRNTELTNW